MAKEISREWKTGTEDDYWVRTCAWSAPGCHPTGCGLKLHVKDGKLVEVEGDEEHPISQGRLCVRCLALKEYEYHPDRLVYPMRRNKEDRGLDKWERITWDEAYEEIVEKTEAIRAEWGARSLAVFGGTGREATNYYPALTYAVFRSPNCCTDLSGQSCYGPRCSITNFILGTGYPEFDYAQFFPDRYDNPAYELSEVLVLWGKGPLQSNGDGLFGHAVIDMMKRGTRIICVDPRLTWLTSKSEYHLQLRPGSDAMLALAWLNVIINEDLYDHDFVEKWCYGFDDLKERVQEYTPARAAEVCWLSEEDIVGSARMFANAKTGSIAWGVAIEMMSNGPQVAQCILDLNAITGRFDAPGGVVIGPKATLTGKWRYENQQYVDPEDMEARIGTKEYPASAASMAICHADTVLNVLETGKPYPLKFAWIHSTNLYACGTSVPQRWFEAMKKLDFIVASDLFMTPTIMGLADVFVPVATFPEHDGIVQPHFGRCTHFLGAMNKAVEYGETKSDLEICFDLGKRITPEAWPWDSVTEFYSWMLEDFVGFDFDELRARDAYQAPYQYRKYEKGLCRADGKPGFETVTGLVELKSLQFGAWGDDPLPYYIEPQYSPYSTPDTYKEYPLVLTTGGRKFTSFHSEHRQIDSLRRIDPWPVVEIHPETAAKYGIEDGGWVEIENQFGHCREKAHVTPTVDPRVIHAQHGWWFPEQDGEAPNYYGVFKAQINNLMPHEHIGKLGLGAPYKCLLCKIRPVMGLDD